MADARTWRLRHQTFATWFEESKQQGADWVDEELINATMYWMCLGEHLDPGDLWCAVTLVE